MLFQIAQGYLKFVILPGSIFVSLKRTQWIPHIFVSGFLKHLDDPQLLIIHPVQIQTLKAGMLFQSQPPTIE